MGPARWPSSQRRQICTNYTRCRMIERCMDAQVPIVFDVVVVVVVVAVCLLYLRECLPSPLPVNWCFLTHTKHMFKCSPQAHRQNVQARTPGQNTPPGREARETGGLSTNSSSPRVLLCVSYVRVMVSRSSKTHSILVLRVLGCLSLSRAGYYSTAHWCCLSPGLLLLGHL